MTADTVPQDAGSMRTAFEALDAFTRYVEEKLPHWSSMPHPAQATEDERRTMREELTHAMTLSGSVETSLKVYQAALQAWLADPTSPDFAFEMRRLNSQATTQASY